MAQSEQEAKTGTQSATLPPQKSKRSTRPAGEPTPPETWLQVIQEACNNLPESSYQVIVSNIYPPDNAGNPGKPIASIVIIGAVVADGMLIPAAGTGNAGKTDGAK